MRLSHEVIAAMVMMAKRAELSSGLSMCLRGRDAFSRGLSMCFRLSRIAMYLGGFSLESELLFGLSMCRLGVIADASWKWDRSRPSYRGLSMRWRPMGRDASPGYLRLQPSYRGLSSSMSRPLTRLTCFVACGALAMRRRLTPLRICSPAAGSACGGQSWRSTALVSFRRRHPAALASASCLGILPVSAHPGASMPAPVPTPGQLRGPAPPPPHGAAGYPPTPGRRLPPSGAFGPGLRPACPDAPNCGRETRRRLRARGQPPGGKFSLPRLRTCPSLSFFLTLHSRHPTKKRAIVRAVVASIAELSFGLLMTRPMLSRPMLMPKLRLLTF